MSMIYKILEATRKQKKEVEQLVEALSNVLKVGRVALSELNTAIEELEIAFEAQKRNPNSTRNMGSDLNSMGISDIHEQIKKLGEMLKNDN